MEPTYADTTLRRCARSIVNAPGLWNCAPQTAVVGDNKHAAHASEVGEAIARMMREDAVFVKLWLKSDVGACKHPTSMISYTPDRTPTIEQSAEKFVA